MALTLTKSMCFMPFTITTHPSQDNYPTCGRKRTIHVSRCLEQLLNHRLQLSLLQASPVSLASIRELNFAASYTETGRVFCNRKSDSLVGSVNMVQRVYVSKDGFAYE